MEVEINNKIYKVIIIRKKIKNVYFRITDDLEIQVSASRLIPSIEIKNLIMKNVKAIKKLIDIKERELESNKYFYYLGNKYNIIYDNTAKPYFENDNIHVRNEDKLAKFYKEEVKRIFTKRVNDIKNDFKNLPNFTLKFRKMKTRWGVCNYKDNIITLNTELLKKEATLLDYVIIHELCHFYHHDHSKSFWQEVSIHYPYYKMARKMLRDI